MHLNRFGVLVASILLLAGAARPAASADPAAQDEAAARELALAYARICLAAFPDEAKLADQLARAKAVPLTEAEVRSLLHDDPGRGWRLPGTPFTVTVESPPFRTCAIRRMTRDGLPTAKPYIEAVATYARQHGMKEGAAQQASRRLPSGADTMLLGTPLLRAGASQPSEVSIYVVTNYHGRLDPARWPDTAGGVGVEVRLAHQIVPPR